MAFAMVIFNGVLNKTILNSRHRFLFSLINETSFLFLQTFFHFFASFFVFLKAIDLFIDNFSNFIENFRPAITIFTVKFNFSDKR